MISNHPDHEEAVRSFGLPYHHLVVTHESKPEAERAALELVRGQIDLLVLARYMQILSGEFLGGLGCPAINIHHSYCRPSRARIRTNGPGSAASS